MTEAELQAGLMQAARQLGFLVLHIAEARRSEPGWPDIFCAGHGVAFAFECKGQTGKLRGSSTTKTGRALPGQADWLEELGAAGVWSCVVRPMPADDAIGYEDALAMLSGRVGMPFSRSTGPSGREEALGVGS